MTYNNFCFYNISAPLCGKKKRNIFWSSCFANKKTTKKGNSICDILELMFIVIDMVSMERSINHQMFVLFQVLCCQ